MLKCLNFDINCCSDAQSNVKMLKKALREETERNECKHTYQCHTLRQEEKGAL